MRIGSLFTGYGGLDQAVTQVTGAETVWVSDIDKGACRILAHRYPDVPNLGDITTVDWSAVEPVDILTGGFPCQDVSHAGKRAGLKDGTRSGLWSYMAEAIEALQPRLVVIENVRGLLSAASPSDVEPCPWCVGDEPTFDLRALGTILADLADIGFDARWCGLRAADVGSCHGRFRVFVVAWPNAQDAHEPVGGQWWFAAPGQAPAGRARADIGGPDREGTSAATAASARTDIRADDPAGTLADADRTAPLTLLPTPAVNDMGAGKTVEAWDNWTDAMKAKHGNGNGHGKSLSIETQRLASALLPTPTSRDWKDGGYVEAVDENALLGRVVWQLAGTFKQYAPAVARHAQMLGRPAPAPTEPTGKGGAHRLSPRFVEWMMGLPPGWVTDVPGLSWAEQLKALGNGVVPQQAVAALRHLLEA